MFWRGRLLLGNRTPQECRPLSEKPGTRLPPRYSESCKGWDAFPEGSPQLACPKPRFQLSVWRMVQRFVPRVFMLGAQTSKRPRGRLGTLLEAYSFVKKLGSSFHNVFS